MTQPHMREPIRPGGEQDPLFATNVGVRPRGVWRTFGSAMDFAAEDVGRRWTSLFDGASDPITAGEFKELAGERPVQWFPGMTRRQAEFRLHQHDYQVNMAQYQNRPIAEFLGMFPPYMVDPVTLATLPVGGAQFRAAVMAGSSRQFWKQTFFGGGMVGAASIPVEGFVQAQAYGEIVPEIMAAATLAPVVLAPLGTGLGRVLRGRSVSTLSTAARLAAEDPARFDALARALDSPPERADLFLPQDIGPPKPLEIRLRETFADYPGGVVAWVRDLAVRSESALAKAQRLGIDPDHPAIRDLTVIRARTEAGSAPPGPEHFERVSDFHDAVAGRASPEQVERLRQAGLWGDVEDVLWARRTDATPEERASAERTLQRMEMDPLAESLRDAYRTEPRLRTMEQQALIRRFEESGPDAARAVELNRLEAEYERIAEVAGRLGEEVADSPQPAQGLLAELSQAVAARKRLWDQMEQLREAIKERTVVRGDMDPDQVMAALDAAMLERPNPRYSPEPVVRQSEVSDLEAKGRTDAARRLEDPEMDEIQAIAQELGIDVAQARSRLDAAIRQVEECV